MPDPESYRRILIIRLGALGDVVRTLPVLTSIRRRLPGVHISWLVEEKARTVLDGHPALDDLIVFPRRSVTRQLRAPWRLPGAFADMRRFAGLLRDRRFDAVFELHGVLRSGVMAWATRAPVRIGFPRTVGREFSHIFLTHPVPIPAKMINRVERLLHVVSSAGIPACPEAGFGIVPREPDRRAVDDFLASEGLANGRSTGRPFAVLYPGTSTSQAYKRWPSARYAALAGRLSADLDLDTVIAWGPGEEEMARLVLAAAPDRVRMAPPTTVPALAHLLAHACLYVSGDTGPMHLAAAMGAPVVGIFGPTDPELNRPLAAGGFRAVSLGLDCAPCRKRRCRRLECMERIEVQPVFDAASGLFAAWKHRRVLDDD